MELKSEKISLDLKQIKNINIQFQGNDIEIIPVIPLPDQIIIINNYIRNYFNSENHFISGTDFDYLNAEYSLFLEIIDKFTNISIDNLPIDLSFSSNFLWDEIKENIRNYDQFRKHLDRVVLDVKEEIALKKTLEKSLGSVIENAIESLNLLINKIANQNIDEESLNKLKETVKEILSDIEKNSVVTQIFSETETENKSGRKRRSKK